MLYLDEIVVTILCFLIVLLENWRCVKLDGMFPDSATSSMRECDGSFVLLRSLDGYVCFSFLGHRNANQTKPRTKRSGNLNGCDDDRVNLCESVSLETTPTYD